MCCLDIGVINTESVALLVQICQQTVYYSLAPIDAKFTDLTINWVNSSHWLRPPLRFC